ncbi:MAG: NAD(+)/NADH kinase, partial [Microbacteriaceae bacterium]
MSNTPNGARHMLLVSHIAKQEAIDATLQVDAMLREAGVVTVMARESLTEFEPYVQGLNVAVLDEDVRPEDIEIAIVLGGDGTILRAAEILRGMCC